MITRLSRHVVAVTAIAASVAIHHPVTVHALHSTFDYVVFTVWTEVVQRVAPNVHVPH